MSWLAIRAVAAHELSRRWRSLLLIGVVVGFLGGMLVAGTALARRTASAPDRLLAAVAPGDAEVRVFGSPDLVPAISALPQVERSWPAHMSVVQVEGPTVIYVGVMSGPPRPEGMLAPVLVAGRAPDPAEPHEVLVTESLADALGYAPGDHVRIDMLTAEEVGQFDVGFGEPDGPSAELTVTGVARVPNGVLGSSPVLATPAYSERYAEVAAGTYLHIDLREGARDYAAFAGAVGDLAAEARPPAGGEEFAPVEVSPLSTGTKEAVDAAAILVGGLTVALAISTIAGSLALAQALARHHGLSAHDQTIEAALGMTVAERTLARVLPAGMSAVVAGMVAAATALVGANLEPLGAVRAAEPEPGRLADVTVLVVGIGVLVLGVLALAAATARRAGIATGSAASNRVVGGLRFVPWRSGWALTGTTFALSRGGTRRTVPVRSSLVGMVVGVTGLVAGATFGASLTRLETTPERWGWAGDLAVVDTTDEIQAELLADPRIGALTDIRATAVLLDGTVVPASSFEPITGSMGWTIIEGRALGADSEIVVGTKTASRLGLEVGDTVDVGGENLRLVGLGVGPDVAGDGLGTGVLLTHGTLREHAVRQDFREALLHAAPGVSPADLAAELGERYEIEVRSPPAAVRDLAELGNLPELLGAFLCVLGAVALVHALVLTRTRRAGDLAVLQALGSTPRQAAAALVAMAATTAAIAVAVGLPLGWATARLVWGEVARGTGVAPDVVVPASVWLVAPATVAVAALLALVPAMAVLRSRPAALLRAE